MIRTEDIYMHAPQVHEDILDFSSETSQISQTEESESSHSSYITDRSEHSTSILDILLHDSSEHIESSKPSSEYQSVYEFIDQQELPVHHEYHDDRHNYRDYSPERRDKHRERIIEKHFVEHHREHRDPERIIEKHYVDVHQEENREPERIIEKHFVDVHHREHREPERIIEKHYVEQQDEDRVRRIVQDEIVSHQQPHHERYSPIEKHHEPIVVCSTSFGNMDDLRFELNEKFTTEIGQVKNEILSAVQSQIDNIRNNITSQDAVQHLEKLHVETQENLEFKIKQCTDQCNEYVNQKLLEIESLVVNLQQKNTTQADQIAQLQDTIANNHEYLVNRIDHVCASQEEKQNNHSNEEIHELRRKIDSLERSALTLTKMIERIVPNLKNRANQ